MVNGVVSQVVIGDQAAQAQLLSTIAQVIYRILHAVTVTVDGSAAIVFRI